MLLNKKVIYILTFCPLIFLQSCVSAPPEVYASVPLINGESHPSGEYLPEGMQASLESKKAGEHFTYDNKQMKLGRDYMSALGLNCKEVQVVSKVTVSYETSICKSEKGWFLIPSLMDKRTSEFMEG
ncbi:hypothetical protein [Kangiella shandongensis]|uniref:hypothetical protein n=1 Tax=Kangiella shandongensis TaxID=2763258 RepID=UPI001CBCB708|nr:hypothetical protein [Kangiella shandongensis]